MNKGRLCVGCYAMASRLVKPAEVPAVKALIASGQTPRGYYVQLVEGEAKMLERPCLRYTRKDTE